ncbi:MAG TPA: DUF1343 domain-containing protein [Ignavibacteria bacterium]
MNIILQIQLFVIIFSLFPGIHPHNSIPLPLQNNVNFLLGNQVLLNEKFYIIEGKNIGVVTNNSGVLSDKTLFVDALVQKQNVTIKKIFSPEHGFRGDDRDVDYIDEQTGIPVVTLFGGKKKPSSADLKDIDIILYDIQDAGARFYTFINTMYYCIESALENNKKIIICDRPVVPCADYVDGFMLDKSVKSFVGLLDIPVVYGMTCGELASFINAEYFQGRCDLEICKMIDYKRSYNYSELNLMWAKPSPSMYFPSTAVMYSGTCFLEGTNFSEGRGSEMPFEFVGAPYCNSTLLIEELDSYHFEGVEFNKISFIPEQIASSSNPPKFIGESCNGVFIKVIDTKTVQPFKIGVALLLSLKKLFQEFKWRKDFFIDKLAGTSNLRKMIDTGKSYQEIIDSYQNELDRFKEKRQKYLLYN